MLDVLPSFAEIMENVFLWFDKVFTYFGAWTFVFGAFLIYTIYRMILAPIVGGFTSAGRSDLAKKGRTFYKENFK